MVKLQHTKKTDQYVLTMPRRMVRWLLWEKGDDIIANLRQDRFSIELVCYNKSKLKEELVKKERALESIQRETDLRAQAAKHEARATELKKEIGLQEYQEVVRDKESEVRDLEDEKEFNEYAKKKEAEPYDPDTEL